MGIITDTLWLSPSYHWNRYFFQDLAGCDYFRTSAYFRGLDIYRIVEGIWN